ncbi:hypothetical protein, partial [uncultured Lamprocystis sp.]|uniref:hypothetical protein n=1 Tax=uncultured Lamprocystis sp. TaxID=543132 RepID=UPI0025FB48C8
RPQSLRDSAKAAIKAERFGAGERRTSRHTTHGVFLSQPDRHVVCNTCPAQPWKNQSRIPAEVRLVSRQDSYFFLS